MSNSRHLRANLANERGRSPEQEIVDAELCNRQFIGETRSTAQALKQSQACYHDNPRTQTIASVIPSDFYPRVLPTLNAPTQSTNRSSTIRATLQSGPTNNNKHASTDVTPTGNKSLPSTTQLLTEDGTARNQTQFGGRTGEVTVVNGGKGKLK